MAKEYLTIKETAALIGLSVSSLYKLVSSRKIPVYKPTGRLLFSREEVVAWIEKGKQDVVINQ